MKTSVTTPFNYVKLDYTPIVEQQTKLNIQRSSAEVSELSTNSVALKSMQSNVSSDSASLEHDSTDSNDLSQSSMNESDVIHKPRVEPPTSQFIRQVILDVSGPQLEFRKLKGDESLEELFDDQLLLEPSKVESSVSHFNPTQRLHFLPDHHQNTIYETLYALTQDKSYNPKSVRQLLYQCLETFSLIESAGCQPLALSHESVWCQSNQDQAPKIQVWLTSPAEKSWPQAAAKLMTHLLMLCNQMSEKECPSADELLEVIDILIYAQEISPKQLMVLRKGLLDQYTDCASFLLAFKKADQKSERLLVNDFYAPIVKQAVGCEKYLKRAQSYYSTEQLQEDRYCEGLITINHRQYWVGAIFDGVSTCDFGSGADISEASRIGMLNALESLPKYHEMGNLVNLEGSGVILDFIQRHIEKTIKDKLKLLKEVHQVTDDHHDIKLPTSTVTLALIDDSGLLSLKWVGDSPALILDTDGRLFSLNVPHSLKHEKVRCGDDVETAIRDESMNALTSDLSTLALGYNDRVDHKSYRMKKGDTLILCSDGLIDGFKEDRKKFGSDAYALESIENWMADNHHHPQSHQLYRLINGLCDEADQRRGVDNISVLGIRPIFSKPVEKPKSNHRDKELVTSSTKRGRRVGSGFRKSHG